MSNGAQSWPDVVFSSLFAEPSRNGLTRPKAVRGVGAPMINMGELFAHPRMIDVPAERVKLSALEIKKFSLEVGDLLFARQSLVASGAGKCSIVLRVSETTCFESHLIRVRLNSESVEPLFYFYYFLSPQGFGRIQALVRQVSAAGIRGSELSEMLIPQPPLSIQRRIAEILASYDELIESNQRRIRILEAMARMIYREWCVDYRFPGHDKVEFVQSELGRTPRGWEVKSLSELIAEHIGGGWGKEAPDERHTEPAWVIRGTDIPLVRHSQVASVPYRYHKTSNLRPRQLAVGDIVFEVSGGSKDQPVGRTLIVTEQLLEALHNESFICASFCKRIRPSDEGYGSELMYLSFQEGYESGEIEQFQVQSTGISNFKWTDYIQKTQRLVPSPEFRNHFVDTVRPILALVGTLGSTVANLRRTRDLLLVRLMSGDIDASQSLPAPDPIEI
jgi:type I restriction enzyme S subunit